MGVYGQPDVEEESLHVLPEEGSAVLGCCVCEIVGSVERRAAYCR